MYPAGLDAALQDVASRRCVSCHKADGKGNVQLPQTEWIRIGHPEKNRFLAAPLAKKHGGTGKCGQAVFESTNDPDYRKILKTFEPIAEQLRKKPRMDMIDLNDIPEVCSDKR
jgi:mono/diheme cytochrome c family protein